MSEQEQSSAQTPKDGLLWTPAPEVAQKTQLASFMSTIEGGHFSDYHSLWEWSIENRAEFWSATWDFCEVIGEKGDVLLTDGDKMPGAQFFPNASINFAENLLRRRDAQTAMIFRAENGTERSVSFANLYDQVSRWVQALKDAGVNKGDRVAGYMPNMPETIIAMLAATSIGAIWSSASPDFGVQGVLDRFGQIEPTVLIAADGYFYNGKTVDCLSKVQDVQRELKSLTQTVIVPLASDSPDLSGLENTVTQDDFLAPYKAGKIAFTRLPFNHPLFIMFSSGTTGVPKCITHGHGGTLLQHLKEHRLHCDIRPDDRVFYFTTCGWMMWNWLVSALACEATLLLYDGSPFYPDGNVLWDFTTKHQCKLFGTSAKYIDTLKANDMRPGDTHDLSAVSIITSTGSPLVHESFDYVYDAIKQDVHLASIAGGTDIISCFMLGNPLSPVWRGEIQEAGLGMAVNVFDDQGKPIPPGGGPGELVCTLPFPSMPVGFWNDPDSKKYYDAYFDRFDNIWCHGDWVERTVRHGIVMHGRSDATLNPGGVRIGTSEIYRQVEQIDGVLESLAVGQDWQSDVRVILFVVLKDGVEITDELTKDIKARIRSGASHRHVPAKVVQVTDIPRTKSGKISELAVRDVIHGRPIKNVTSLANPEALDLYKDLGALQEA